MLNVNFLPYNDHPGIRRFLDARTEDDMEPMAQHALASHPFPDQNGSASLLEICAGLGMREHFSFLLQQILHLEGPEKATVLWASFRQAKANGNNDIANTLLEFVEVFDKAEAARHERDEDDEDELQGNYTSTVRPYAERALVALQRKEREFKDNHLNADAVFDIDRSEAPFYHVALRHLIRTNEREWDGAITLLLSLPSLAMRVHRPFAVGGESNELLRVAMARGNRAAAAALLAVPEVFDLANQANFYEEHQAQENPVNLREMAANSESSMGAFNQRDLQVADGVVTHYRDKMNRLGGTGVGFETFKTAVEEIYRLNPAQVSIGGRLTNLPLKRLDFDNMPMSGSERTAALQAYYKHPVHTTFRFLSRPNPWVSPYSPYKDYDLTSYKADMAYYWMAVSDPNMPESDGYTREGRMDIFIKQIALIGRAHNWDETRPKVDTLGKAVYKNGIRVQEEYDDGGADKPSCYSGMKRRFFTAVQGHPLFSGFSAEVLRQEIYQMIRSHFTQQLKDIPEEKRTEISAALNAMILELEPASDALVALNISESEVRTWLNQMHLKYPKLQEKPEMLSIVRNTFKLGKGECHLSKFCDSHKLTAFLGDEAQIYGWPESPPENHSNFFFALQCLAGCASVVGLALIVAGLITSQLVMTAGGAGVVVLGGIAMAKLGLFSRKAPEDEIPDYDVRYGL